MLNEYKQDSLRDLITKSRKTSNISSLMNKSLNDIKKEIVSADRNVRIHAIQKLIFFYLNNCDIKWASFHTLEILATCGAPGKRFGYEIGQLQYKNNPDYLMLIPQLIRKDLISQNFNYINSALNFLNHTMEISLAKELTPDLEKLLNVNNNLIRKKLIVALTKASEKFLLESQTRFWDDLIVKLISILNSKDLHTGVAICIISSIQKICNKFPERCITVFVELMNYFTKCEINWNLIKIVDIFGMLFQYESKFTKKKEFIKIIAEQLSKTKSKSVEVQLVKLVISNFDVNTNPSAAELFQNCEERLKNLLFFNDNNLVIISLRICKELFNKNKIVSINYLQDVLKILDSNSNTSNGNKNIQNECLEIINLSVSKDNYKEIAEHLFELRNQLGPKVILTILNICSHDSYSRLSSKDSFLWFLDILFTLADSEFGKETELKISYIIRDIAQRIEILRETIADRSFELIIKLLSRVDAQVNDENNQKKKISFIGESNLFTENLKTKSPDTLITVLTFILGEYSQKNKETLNSRLKTLINFINDVKTAKENYFIPITYCLIKLLFKTLQGKLDENGNEHLEKIEKFIDYHNNFSDLEMLEMNVILKTIIKSLRNNNINEKTADSFFSNLLLPTHDQAQQMVTVPKEAEISICFPLNEEELNIAKKIEMVEKAPVTNLSTGNVETNETSKEIIIDKKIYTPQSLADK